jgi:hypothetical protein
MICYAVLLVCTYTSFLWCSCISLFLICLLGTRLCWYLVTADAWYIPISVYTVTSTYWGWTACLFETCWGSFRGKIHAESTSCWFYYSVLLNTSWGLQRNSNVRRELQTGRLFRTIFQVLFTYLLAYLLTCLLAYLLTYLLTYIPTYLHTYLATYLLNYLATYLLTCLLTYLHTHLLTYVLTYIPT